MPERNLTRCRHWRKPTVNATLVQFAVGPYSKIRNFVPKIVPFRLRRDLMEMLICDEKSHVHFKLIRTTRRRPITDEYLRRKIRILEKSAERHRYNVQPGKRRFGLYRYLRDVYALYLELRSRRNARKATRRIIKLADLSIQKNAHPLRVLIEASAGLEDARQKSRWVQALRCAWGWRQQANRLDWFLSVNGGIAGAAAKLAKRNDTAGRPKSSRGRSIAQF